MRPSIPHTRSKRRCISSWLSSCEDICRRYSPWKSKANDGNNMLPHSFNFPYAGADRERGHDRQWLTHCVSLLLTHLTTHSLCCCLRLRKGCFFRRSALPCRTSIRSALGSAERREKTRQPSAERREKKETFQQKRHMHLLCVWLCVCMPFLTPSCECARSSTGSFLACQLTLTHKSSWRKATPLTRVVSMLSADGRASFAAPLPTIGRPQA